MIPDDYSEFHVVQILTEEKGFVGYTAERLDVTHDALLRWLARHPLARSVQEREAAKATEQDAEERTSASCLRQAKSGNPDMIHWARTKLMLQGKRPMRLIEGDGPDEPDDAA